MRNLLSLNHKHFQGMCLNIPIHPLSENGHPKSPNDSHRCLGLKLAISYDPVTEPRYNLSILAQCWYFVRGLARTWGRRGDLSNSGQVIRLLSDEVLKFRNFSCLYFCLWNVCFKSGPLFFGFFSTPGVGGPARVPITKVPYRTLRFLCSGAVALASGVRYFFLMILM